MYLRHISQQNPCPVWREQKKGGSDAGSDMMDMNPNMDSTGEAESQLNLALEKSISGCWAMNLRRQNMSESHMRQNVTKEDKGFYLKSYCFVTQNDFIIKENLTVKGTSNTLKLENTLSKWQIGSGASLFVYSLFT